MHSVEEIIALFKDFLDHGYEEGYRVSPTFAEALFDAVKYLENSIDARDLKKYFAYRTYQNFCAAASPDYDWASFTEKEVEEIIDKFVAISRGGTK